MSFYDARKMFDENLRLFSDPSREPEKYNLYKGLYNMADSMIYMEENIGNIVRLLQQRQ